MDEQMMRQLLQSYGAPMSAKNANIAREFFASNPDIAERRAMGMRGSALDDNSDLLGAYLNKVIAESTVPQGRVEVGSPQLADSPPASVNSAPAGTARPSKMDLNNDMTALTPKPSRQGNYGEATTSDKRGLVEPGSVYGSGSMVGEDKSWLAKGADASGISEWLLAALGLSSLAGKGMMNGQARLPAPNAPDASGGDTKLLTGPERKQLGYEPKLEDKSGPKMPSGAPEMDNKAVQQTRGKFQDPAEVSRMKAEVEAENRLLMEQMKKQKDQRAAEELVRAAKRATGRR